MKLHLSKASDLVHISAQQPSARARERIYGISWEYFPQLYDHQVCFCWKIHGAHGRQNGQLEPKDSEVQAAVGQTEHFQTRKDTRATVSTASTYESGTH